jgi:hypothetical protein
MTTTNNMAWLAGITCVFGVADCGGKAVTSAESDTPPNQTSTGGAPANPSLTFAVWTGGATAGTGTGGTPPVDLAALTQCPAVVATTTGGVYQAAAPCTPGEVCACHGAWQTGCPSYRKCHGENGGAYAGYWGICNCATCTLQLDPSACSWTLASTDDAGVRLPNGTNTTVTKTDAGGNVTTLALVGSESACTGNDGYYAVAVYNDPVTSTMIASLTLTLCPASCAEHQQTSSETFELYRGDCIITID